MPDRDYGAGTTVVIQIDGLPLLLELTLRIETMPNIISTCDNVTNKTKQDDEPERAAR